MIKLEYPSGYGKRTIKAAMEHTLGKIGEEPELIDIGKMDLFRFRTAINNTFGNGVFWTKATDTDAVVQVGLLAKREQF